MPSWSLSLGRILCLASLPLVARAQNPGWQVGPTQVEAEVNVVWQGNPSFPAAYSGPLSLPANGEFHSTRLARVATLTRIAKRWSVEADVEAANGLPLGGGTGLAGVTNLDVTHALSPSLAPQLYWARLIAETRGRGWKLHLGRLSLTDYFDQNSVLGDDHRQFLNWSDNNSVAWDYAADTRGYTDAGVLELGDWTAAYALMPNIANGMRLNWLSSSLILQRTVAWAGTTVELLSYANHATMGQYDRAATDVTAVRSWRWKEGLGMDAEHAFGGGWSLAARAGAENDAVESFAYTEAENTFSAAAAAWSGHHHRQTGLAFTSNGLSAAHAAYLARGGAGFQLGDGALLYARENILEWYGTLRQDRYWSWGPDLQWIHHPGYNQARGPVAVYGFRVHVGP